MPNCRTCKKPAALHELIDDLCFKCTAKERDALMAVMAPLVPIGQRITTQDNRITSHPIFMVQEGVGRHWINRQPCFTDNGAQAVIDADGHNYQKSRIYVASGYRNNEWIAIREALKRMGDAATPVPCPHDA